MQMKQMKICLFLFLMPLLFCGLVAGEVVYRCDFSPDGLKGWRLGGIATTEKTPDGYVLKITAAADRAHNKISLPLNLAPWSGKILRMSCKMKLDDVTKPKHKWNGSKFMLVWKQGPDGTMQYRHPEGRFGTADWFDVVHYAVIGPNPTSGSLQLGLEESKGTIRFRDLKLELLELTEVYPAVAPAGTRAVYTDRVSRAPRRRGAMSPSRFRNTVISKDLPDLRSWGANLIRWQLVRNWNKVGDNRNVEEYLAWIDGRIPEVQQVLDKAQQLGMKVVLDLHVAPGGRRANGEMEMFYNRKYADAFLEAWRRLAQAVKGHPALYGYDLINEPKHHPGAPIDYLVLQYEAAKVVRAIDPETPLIIEANDMASPQEFSYLHVLPLKDVIYQVHMYKPGSYTHQGVRKRPLTGRYPGKINNAEWNKESLREALRPVREFQLKYGAKIYVGEFSAIRWAPGGAQYLEDCLSLFEEYGWDWSYHAFREWSGWSVEHTSDRNNPGPSPVDTDRKKVLIKYLKLNDEKGLKK